MNPANDIKRFILRALLRFRGLPWPDPFLDDAARRGVFPQPLLSEIHEAKRELESRGFIQAERDDLDGQITWTLTPKGQHKARLLGDP